MENLKTSFLNETQLPLVIEPIDESIHLADSLQLIAANKGKLRESLLRHGGLLFRNFPIACAHDFVAVLKSLEMGEFCHYVGGDSPRKKVVGGVYTSTEAPPSMKLPLHNELSYVKSFPSHIHFYCEVAPRVNGQTIIGDCRKIYQSIDPEVLQRFEGNRLKYVSCYPYKSKFMNFVNKSHKSWINVFETEDKQEVEKKCAENEIAYEWTRDNWIKISQERPATLTHPQTGEKAWFNQAHHFDFNPKFLGWFRYLGTKLLYARKHTLLHDIFFSCPEGNEMKIPRSDLYHVLDVLDQHTIYFSWQKGDVLVLDNILTMHGRASFSGPRRVLTAMTN